jgi:predicted acylesterase/phospholipase RssA
VLAGGGAKGAFQAGAMRAIYRFLADNNALNRVKVISGTSIGAWNALFWLADLIESEEPHKASAHQNWWSSITLRSLVAPSWYFPAFRNFFFDTTPWQRMFEDIFEQPEVKKHVMETKTKFYFTYSQVLSGELGCVTNNRDASGIPEKLTFTTPPPSGDADAFWNILKFGVFASMDLPPLFPYTENNGNYFEDGGVIDNLPILFATMEECDLVFVLPLNSDFIEVPDHRSIMHRILRVMDVRRGALERTSLKNAYLFNEIAVLRTYAETLTAKMTAAQVEPPVIDPSQETLLYSLQRKHRLAKIFAICPDRSFVENTIDTHELWKANAARQAFEKMYEATTKALATFDPAREKIGLWLVNMAGHLDWRENIF